MTTTDQVPPGIDWFWTSAGKALAYRADNGLFSGDGLQIGLFRGDEIYGLRGEYLGEIAPTGRLVTQMSKLGWLREGFVPVSGRPVKPPPNIAAERMSSGCRDFKCPKRRLDST